MGLMAFTNHLAGRVNGNGNGGGGYELNGRGVLPNWGVVGKERLVKTNLFPSAHEGLRFRPGALSFSVGVVFSRRHVSLVTSNCGGF